MRIITLDEVREVKLIDVVQELEARVRVRKGEPSLGDEVSVLIFASGDGSQPNLCTRVHEDVPLDEAVQDEMEWIQGCRE